MLHVLMDEGGRAQALWSWEQFLGLLPRPLSVNQASRQNQASSGMGASVSSSEGPRESLRGSAIGRILAFDGREPAVVAGRLQIVVRFIVWACERCRFFVSPGIYWNRPLLA